MHGNARGQDRHHRKADRIEAARPLVETELEVFGHAAGLAAVIEGHHEDGQEDHRGDGADPVEVAGGDAVLGAAGPHADQLQRARFAEMKASPVIHAGIARPDMKKSELLFIERFSAKPMPRTKRT